MSHVSGGLSAQVVKRRFQRRHGEDEVLEWLGGTVSPSTVMQARILGESYSGSGEEASVGFKVVSEEWYAVVDVARPHALEWRPGRYPNPTRVRSCLGVPGSARGVSDV
jgi:hypothetical protein